MDDQELADELAELEQEELNKRLAGAEAAPIHSPAAAIPAGKPRLTCAYTSGTKLTHGMPTLQPRLRLRG